MESKNTTEKDPDGVVTPPYGQGATIEVLLNSVDAEKFLASTAQATAAQEPEERLLTSEQAAERLAVKADWLFRHGAELPFRVRLGPRHVRYSESGLNRWIRQREGKRR